MHKLYSVVAVLIVLSLLPTISNGQHLVRVPPFGGTNYLNDFIMGDTLANGQRRASSAVYVLQRGAAYLANAVTRNVGWTLRIQSHDTTAGVSKPAVFLYPNPTTQLPPGQFIAMRGNVSLKNIILSGYFEPLPANLSGLQGALFNTEVPGLNLTIDSCLLTNTNGNHVRTDQAPRTIRITNCIFANMGYLGRSNLGAGKGIDVRGGSVDSLILYNNTFVNWQDRIIRHYASTANIKYLRFDHNTLVNGMSYHGMLSLGRVGFQGIITNNLLIDAFALGNDTDAVRQAEFTDSGEMDQWGFPRMTWVIANPNDTTQWTIKSNYYAISPAGITFWAYADAIPQLTQGSPLTYFINKKLGADSVNAFKQADVTLNNIPNLMVAMMTWYRTPASLGGAGKTKNTGNWNASDDFDRRAYQYFRDTLDCRYPTALPIYTAGTAGYPVGDLNWFPARKAQWEKDPAVGVTERTSALPTRFALDQNYPNPFNPATKISFTLEKAGYTTLAVYNVLGQKVAVPVDKELPSGQHEVQFDASRLSSGVYFYKLESGNFVDVKKMMLLR